MFLIRRPRLEDVDPLLKLARTVHFINLPADRDIIGEKIQWSRNSFLLAAESVEGLGRQAGTVADSQEHLRESSAFASGLRAVTGRAPLFLFVLEDTESGMVVGTSQIVAQMGGPGHPNLAFQLSQRTMFSEALQTGATHTTARLHLDESGPTEVGGIVLQSSLRGHRLRLGTFLSLVRFHFIGLHRGMFSDRVLAELMAPFDASGHNPFWEYLGRRFINLTYAEADRFCQHSKEFMLALLPREEIYLTLLPPEARSVVGQVGPETRPARRLLEKLGFQYHQRIDPFDGGPHLEAATDQITIVRETRRARLGAPIDSPGPRTAIVSVMPDSGDFVSVSTDCALDRSGKVQLPARAMAALGARPGDSVGLTLLADKAGGSPAAPGAAGEPKRATPGPKRSRRKVGA